MKTTSSKIRLVIDLSVGNNKFNLPHLDKIIYSRAARLIHDTLLEPTKVEYRLEIVEVESD